MKREEPSYPMRQNVNTRMRYNLNSMHSPHCCGDNETERSVNCGDEKGNGIVNAPALSMVYAPIQEWREIYDIAAALERGTLFKELDKPLEVCDKCRGGGIHGF
jgi:hypothetical protein